MVRTSCSPTSVIVCHRTQYVIKLIERTCGPKVTSFRCFALWKYAWRSRAVCRFREWGPAVPNFASFLILAFAMLLTPSPNDEEDDEADEELYSDPDDESL